MYARPEGRWGDLRVRLVSCIGMAIPGVAVIVLGGWPLLVTVSVIGGLMAWESCRLLEPGRNPLALQAGVGLGMAIFAAGLVGDFPASPILLLIPALAVAGQAGANRVPIAALMLAVALAGLGLFHIRDVFGMAWFAWLIAIVLATDISGYLSGRFFGGRKIWPALSPGKTWAGMVGGWVCAALVGGFLVPARELAAVWPVVFAVSVAIVAQLADLAESALKRYAGAKDSSGLIPGHGGLLDRFDGIVGAALYASAFAHLPGMRPMG